MDENRSGVSRKGRVALAPRLEPLEGRRLMAANAGQVGIKEITTDGVVDLVITGTARGDVVKVIDNGTDAVGNITVQLGDGRTYVSKGAVATVGVLGKGGNDRVSYELAANLVVPRTVVADLGAGNDRFTGTINGAVANPIGLDVEAYGGAGDDTLAVIQAGATLSGGTLPYLDGGAGDDTLAYTGTGAIAANASVLPGLSGGAGNDRIASNYAGMIAGNYIYNLTVDGGAGDDDITDTVHALAGSTGTIGTDAATPAAVLGGSGDDRITFTVQADPAAAPAGLNAVVVGGAGKDVIRRKSTVLGDRTNEKDSVLS